MMRCTGARTGIAAQQQASKHEAQERGDLPRRLPLAEYHVQEDSVEHDLRLV